MSQPNETIEPEIYRIDDRAKEGCRFCNQPIFEQVSLEEVSEMKPKTYTVLGISNNEVDTLLLNHTERALAHALAMGKVKERGYSTGAYQYGMVIVVSEGKVEGKYPI